MSWQTISSRCADIINACSRGYITQALMQALHLQILLRTCD